MKTTKPHHQDLNEEQTGRQTAKLLQKLNALRSPKDKHNTTLPTSVHRYSQLAIITGRRTWRPPARPPAEKEA
jgi:hypothetical protein